MSPSLQKTIINNMTAGDLVAMNERATAREGKDVADKRFYAFVSPFDIIEGKLRIGEDGEIQIGDGNGGWRTDLSVAEVALLRKSFPGFKKLFIVTDSPSLENLGEAQRDE